MVDSVNSGVQRGQEARPVQIMVQRKLTPDEARQIAQIVLGSDVQEREVRRQAHVILAVQEGGNPV